MTVRVRSVVKFQAECTEPECAWRQLHDDLESACTDAKRHRMERHPRPGEAGA